MKNSIETEIWKDVVGYEGVYSVSNFGRVRRDGSSTGAIKGRILKHAIAGGGYYVVTLSKNNSPDQFFVHRLVAMAFCENADPISNVQVNHIDGVKTNNLPANLEWCTARRNSIHAFSKGLRKPKTKCKLDHSQMILVKFLRSQGLSFRKLGSMFAVTEATIRYALKVVLPKRGVKC